MMQDCTQRRTGSGPGEENIVELAGDGRVPVAAVFSGANNGVLFG